MVPRHRHFDIVEGEAAPVSAVPLVEQRSYFALAVATLCYSATGYNMPTVIEKLGSPKAFWFGLAGLLLQQETAYNRTPTRSVTPRGMRLWFSGA